MLLKINKIGILDNKINITLFKILNNKVKYLRILNKQHYKKNMSQK